MKGFFKAISYSNIWIAILAALLTFQSYFLFHLPYNFFYISFVFLGTISLYNFQRLVKNIFLLEIELSERHQWIRTNRKFIILITAISFIWSFVLFFTFSLNESILLLLLAIVSLLYTGVSGKKNGFALREIPGIKAFLIAGVWVTITLIIPVLNTSAIQAEHLFFILHQFILVLILAFLFDIRDLDKDVKHLRTIPQLVGKNKALFICLILTLALPLIMWFGFNDWILLMFASFTGVYLFIVILLMQRDRQELFYHYLVDGVFLMQVVLAYFLLA